MSRKIAIIQPCYIPWKGYFDIIANVDEFVIFDDVDFVRRTWYNRNRIKGEDGSRWLTIPVSYSQTAPTLIKDTPIHGGWVDEHLDIIRTYYHKAPYFGHVFPGLEAAYESVRETNRLGEVTTHLIQYLCSTLGLTTPLIRASTLGAKGKKTDRLLEICKKRKAKTYLSGPAAQAYFETEKFKSANITVEWMDYSGYPEYKQLGLPFEHHVSILDLLFMTGENAHNYMKHVK